MYDKIFGSEKLKTYAQITCLLSDRESEPDYSQIFPKIHTF